MKYNEKEENIKLTPLWNGERFSDGRPRVEDKYIAALHKMTLEEIWKPLFTSGYENQFEGKLHRLHDDSSKLIGRAVTCNFVPTRPDLHDLCFAQGASEGRKGTYNQWVIDSLVDGDVVVCDMYDKIYKGTFVGGNLATAIKTKTNTGGAIIWGGIRDVEQMKSVEGFQTFYRGIDPTPIRDFVMTGFNTVTRIGKAVCLPGDIVFADYSGVLFIPSHKVAEVVDGASKTHVKDMFGFEMISKNIFTTAQIDKNTWSKEMLDLLVKFINEDPRGKQYESLDWTKEYVMAENGDDADTQSAL